MHVDNVYDAVANFELNADTASLAASIAALAGSKADWHSLSAFFNKI